MNRNQSSRMRVCLFVCLSMLMGNVGCVTPFNTRTPQVVHRPVEMERREAQVHDPYPDAKFGPDTGFRPLGFTEQRSEPQRAKDRFFTAKLRSNNGSPFGPQTMMPLDGRPQVTNPHMYGTQSVYTGQPQQYSSPTAYSGNGYPQPVLASPQPIPATQQISSGVAPVAPPVYYPPSYR